MKKILILALLLFASSAFAILPDLPRDGGGQKLQGFAPGKRSQALTVNSVTTSGDIGWSVYSPTACKFRAMSTATKAGVQFTIPVNTTIERRVNVSAPFINFSGCTSGELQRQ